MSSIGFLRAWSQRCSPHVTRLLRSGMLMVALFLCIHSFQAVRQCDALSSSRQSPPFSLGPGLSSVRSACATIPHAPLGENAALTIGSQSLIGGAVIVLVIACACAVTVTNPQRRRYTSISVTCVATITLTLGMMLAIAALTPTTHRGPPLVSVPMEGWLSYLATTIVLWTVVLADLCWWIRGEPHRAPGSGRAPDAVQSSPAPTPTVDWTPDA